MRAGVQVKDALVTEEPIEIRVDGRPLAVLMRTPGHSQEEDLDLVAGFLATEGVIDGVDDLAGLATCVDPNRPNGAKLFRPARTANRGVRSTSRRVT